LAVEGKRFITGACCLQTAVANGSFETEQTFQGDITLSLMPVSQVDGKRFITGEILARSPAITFLWVKRFPLGK
jgi:hypothetical protein